jgi:hypothetical protein
VRGRSSTKELLSASPGVVFDGKLIGSERKSGVSHPPRVLVCLMCRLAMRRSVFTIQDEA